jgi:hypothetical protein
MALSNDTLDLIIEGYTLCDECGDFIDFGGCRHSTPPLDKADTGEYGPPGWREGMKLDF